MFNKLPLEIYYKLINYGIYEPPHYIAYKTAKIRPVFSNELNCNISGTITLKEDLFAIFDNVEINQMTDLDAEYYMFLLNQ